MCELTVLSTYALNDVLIAHPCPAAVSQFSFKIKSDDQPCSPLVNSRSSGLRVSTAAGSTAAMLSAGGFPMPILSEDLQFMVREPMSPGETSSLMHGLIKSHQSMDATWFLKRVPFTLMVLMFSILYKMGIQLRYLQRPQF
ncbi:hypothetical protein Pyn_30060 [Prunus yedoensis var. nudiflora]|uniref:Uncharacterized protein n=1 Tax=Prunus yedoensis var. nudiflora TaxID=2094558 RepID=A0A314ZJX9_PRUYE|nr:hypothetical protein Pyn_30060 [Prunus yedoensis var. nudiflora]